MHLSVLNYFAALYYFDYARSNFSSFLVTEDLKKNKNQLKSFGSPIACKLTGNIHIISLKVLIEIGHKNMLLILQTVPFMSCKRRLTKSKLFSNVGAYLR